MDSHSPIRSILIPTDFSECAQWAVDAGVWLAERFGASLHLLHVFPAGGGRRSALPLVEGDVEEMRQDARKRMADLVTGHYQLDVTRAVETGNLYQIAGRYADEHGISLVVIGSHGASGKNEFFIGSNTQRVVRSVHCPVLILKEPLEQVAFDKVLFASRFYTDELPAFRFFLDLVRPFLPEIHLVEVHTGSLFDPLAMVSQEAMQDFRKETGSLTCTIHLAHDLSADKGIRGLAEELGADLIAISNHLRHPLKRMLVGSTVEALVNHADIPVLSIDFRK